MLFSVYPLKLLSVIETIYIKWSFFSAFLFFVYSLVQCLYKSFSVDYGALKTKSTWEGSATAIRRNIVWKYSSGVAKDSYDMQNFRNQSIFVYLFLICIKHLKFQGIHASSNPVFLSHCCPFNVHLQSTQGYFRIAATYLRVKIGKSLAKSQTIDKNRRRRGKLRHVSHLPRRQGAVIAFYG